MKFFLPQKCLNKTQIAFIFSSLIKKEAPIKELDEDYGLFLQKRSKPK